MATTGDCPEAGKCNGTPLLASRVCPTSIANIIRAPFVNRGRQTGRPHYVMVESMPHLRICTGRKGVNVFGFSKSASLVWMRTHERPQKCRVDHQLYTWVRQLLGKPFAEAVCPRRLMSKTTE